MCAYKMNQAEGGEVWKEGRASQAHTRRARYCVQFLHPLGLY